MKLIMGRSLENVIHNYVTEKGNWEGNYGIKDLSLCISISHRCGKIVITLTQSSKVRFKNQFR